MQISNLFSEPLFGDPPPPLPLSLSHQGPIQQNEVVIYKPPKLQDARNVPDDIFIDLITISSDEEDEQIQSNPINRGENPSSNDSTSSDEDTGTGNEPSNATSARPNSRVLHRYSMAEDRQFSRKTSTPIHWPGNQHLATTSAALPVNRNTATNVAENPNTPPTIKREIGSSTNLNSHMLNSAKPQSTPKNANSSSSSSSDGQSANQVKQERVSPTHPNAATSSRTPPSVDSLKREKSTPVKNVSAQSQSQAASVRSRALNIPEHRAVKPTPKVTSANTTDDDTR